MEKDQPDPDEGDTWWERLLTLAAAAERTAKTADTDERRRELLAQAAAWRKIAAKRLH